MATFISWAWKSAIARHGRGQPQQELAFTLDSTSAKSDMRQIIYQTEEPMPKVPAIYKREFGGRSYEAIAPPLTTDGASDKASQSPILFWTTEDQMPTDDERGLQQSMFSPVDSPVRITQSQETATDWLATAARSGGNISGSLLSSAPPGLLPRMCPGSSLVQAAETLRSSSGRSPNAGMAWSGQFWMLNTSEWRNDAAVCSLSDILEDSPDLKYSLSAKACSGILNRAENRGRALPAALRSALQAVTSRQA